MLTITNDRYINSQSVCQLLLKIVEAVGHGAITVVLDNARYQKCKLVQDYAEILGIELLFLPAPIHERLVLPMPIAYAIFSFLHLLATH